MFFESLISGFATALAYVTVMAVLIAVLVVVARKLGPLIYLRMMGQMVETFTLALRGSSANVSNPPSVFCQSCQQGPFDTSFRYCPFCSEEITREFVP